LAARQSRVWSEDDRRKCQTFTAATAEPADPLCRLDARPWRQGFQCDDPNRDRRSKVAPTHYLSTVRRQPVRPSPGAPASAQSTTLSSPIHGGAADSWPMTQKHPCVRHSVVVAATGQGVEQSCEGETWRDWQRSENLMSLRQLLDGEIEQVRSSESPLLAAAFRPTPPQWTQLTSGSPRLHSFTPRDDIEAR
jgi:hypothetical protein